MSRAISLDPKTNSRFPPIPTYQPTNQSHTGKDAITTRAADRAAGRGGGGRGDRSLTRTAFAPVAEVEAAFLRPFPMLARTERIIDPAPDGMRTVETNYTDAQGRVQVRILTVEGGGHAWPGSLRATRHGGTRDIDATAEVLRFFAQHP